MRHRALTIVAVFVIVATALVILKSSGSLHPPLSRERAKAAALADPQVRSFVRQEGWTTIKTLPLDQTHWRVTFFDGARLVLDASVAPSGRVVATELHRPGVHEGGSSIAWRRLVLVGLTVLFVVATAVAPLARLRNLDVAIFGGAILAVLLLYDARLVAGEAYTGAALLAYLGGRCAWLGLRGEHGRPAVPLYRAVLGRVPAAVRLRVAVLVTSALLVATGLITYGSSGITDVAFAGMAGATAIQRGHVPYGHITNEVVHGDTYPPLTYVMYLPFSLASPVDDGFDDLQGALDLNALALLAAAAFAFVIGSRVFDPRRDPVAGLAMAVAWLSCPAILLAASGGGNDVPTALFVMAAVALATTPAPATGLLAIATAAKLGPVGGLVVGLAALRRRTLLTGAALTLLVAVATLALLVGLGGGHAIPQMIDALAFQFRRGSFYSPWTQIGSGGAQAVFQAIVLTFAVIAVVHVARRDAPPSLRRACALAAAIVLGLQLAANYWTYAYLAWAMPLILVALFPPLPRRSPPPAPRVP